MSARRIRKTWWADFQVHGIRHRKRSPENSRVGALTYEAFLRQRLARGEKIEASSTASPDVESKTLEEFARAWLKTVSGNYKPRELVRKESALRVHILPFFAGKRLNEITAREIEEFKASLQKKGLAPNTVNNTINVLSRCLRSAVEWGDLQSIPLFRRVKVPPSRFDYLAPHEIDLLLAACKGSDWYKMILLAARTGMRFGEIVALEWSDVDFRHNQIAVQRSVSHKTVTAPKNNRRRDIPMAEDLRKELNTTRDKSGMVCKAVDDGFITHSMARKALEKYCRKAGIRKIGWHMLRHTFASHLVSNGVSLQVVQQFLGHSDMKVTLRYAHLAPSTLQDAIKVLTMREGKIREEMATGCQRESIDAMPPLHAGVALTLGILPS